jgi:hypothetical protein
MSRKVHLIEFLKLYIDETFRRTWNITEDLMESRAQQLFDDLNVSPRYHENLWQDGDDNDNDNDDVIISEIVLEKLMRKYVSTLTECQQELTIASMESVLIGQFALVAHFEDGGNLSHWNQYLHQSHDTIRVFRLQDIARSL